MRAAFIKISFLAIAISCSRPQNPPAPNVRNEMWVTTNEGLRLRQSPDLQGKVVMLLPKLAQVQVLESRAEKFQVSGVEGTWTRIQFGEKTGWVFSGFLTATAPDLEQLLKAARLRYPDLFVREFARQKDDPLSGGFKISGDTFELSDGGMVLQGKIVQLAMQSDGVRFDVSGKFGGGQDAAQRKEGTGNWQIRLVKSAAGFQIECPENLPTELKGHCGKPMVPTEP